VFTIGSHGKSHRVMTAIPFAEAVDEITTSKALIEDKLGGRVDFFSYPKGSITDVSEALEEHVRKAGYAASFGTVLASNTLAGVRAGSVLNRYNAEPFGGFTFARLLDGSCDLIGIKDTAIGASGKRTLNKTLGTTTR
jgi:peptidoglycan/xylan/chitin deacetylase (PgdA/CDA1 family)